MISIKLIKYYLPGLCFLGGIRGNLYSRIIWNLLQYFELIYFAFSLITHKSSWALRDRINTSSTKYGVSAGKRDQIEFFLKKMFLSKLMQIWPSDPEHLLFKKKIFCRFGPFFQHSPQLWSTTFSFEPRLT